MRLGGDDRTREDIANYGCSDNEGYLAMGTGSPGVIPTVATDLGEPWESLVRFYIALNRTAEPRPGRVSRVNLIVRHLLKPRDVDLRCALGGEGATFAAVSCA